MTPVKRVLRHTIAINDLAHMIPAGPIVLFDRGPANRIPGLNMLVDVWVETPTPADWPATTADLEERPVQVVGTGQPVPETWQHLASFVDDRLVWHLYEVSA